MPVIFGHELTKKQMYIGGGVVVVLIAAVLWLRSRAAAAAAAPAADQGAMPAADTSGAMSIPVASSDQASQYSQDLLNSQLQAQQIAAQYQQQLQQQQYTQAALMQANANPLAVANQAAAAFFSGADLSQAQATGARQENWAQYTLNGQTIWEDVSGKHRAPITELQAQELSTGPTGEGPYYQSAGGGFFKPLLKSISNMASNALGQLPQMAADAYGVPISASDPIYAQAPTTYPAPGASASPYGPSLPAGIGTGTDETAMTASIKRQQPQRAASIAAAPAAPHGYPELV